jgi:hypothetical protein
MPTRVSLRRVGDIGGKLAAVPESLAELLALATKKLKLDTPASRIFTSSADELDDDDDVQLLREDEVLYVSCGEDFMPPTAVPVAAEPPAPAVTSKTLEVPPVPAAKEPPAPAIEEPPAQAVEEPPAVKEPAGVNVFEQFSLDDATAAAAIHAVHKPPMSVEAVREKIKADPTSAFGYMMRGGSGEGGGGAKLCILNKPDARSDSNGDIYDFCAEPDKFLQLREAASVGDGEAGSSSAPLQPPLVMGEWTVVKVPPPEAKKDKGCTKIALKPSISALKKVYESRKVRESAKPGWEYPTDSQLIATFSTEKHKVKYQDFRSVLAPASAILKKARKAVVNAEKPASLDQGSIRKLTDEFNKAEEERKRKSKDKQAAWTVREADIDGRLKTANDVFVRALPGAAKEEAQLAVGVIQEEQRNFYTARSLEKKALDEEKTEAKRKYNSDVSKHQTHIKTVKGESRKKMKTALEAATPMEEEPPTRMDASAVTVGIGAAARARDPDVQLAAAVVRRAIAAALAELAEPHEEMEVDG